MSNNMLDILKNFDRASNPVSECGMDGGVSFKQVMQHKWQKF
jgi:hypothetical protein